MQPFLLKLKKNMKNFIKEIPIWLRIVILIVLAILIFIAIRNLMVYVKKIKAENLLNNATATGGTGSTAFSTNYGSVAQRIYSAFYDNDWFGWTENEEAAIVAVNDVPKAFIPQLKETYFNLYGKNLNEDCIKYLKDEYPRVQNQLN